LIFENLDYICLRTKNFIKMENKKSILKYSTTPGIILGIVFILISVIIYVSGIDQFENKWANNLIYIPMIIAIVYYQKDYRDNLNSGFLSIGEAVKIGVTVVVIATILSSIYSFIFLTYIEPDFMENMLIKVEEQILETNPEMTEAQLDMSISMAKKFMTPAFTIPMAIIWNAILALVVSLISGLVLKKSDAPL